MRIVALLVVASGLSACGDDERSPDAGDGAPQADAEADTGADVDIAPDGDFIPLECGDDPQNFVSCMISVPGWPEWGVWCAAECRPSCGPLLGLECPEQLVCHRAGPNGVCFPP